MVPVAIRITDGGEFVDAAERSVRVAGGETCAHPPDADLASPALEIGDPVFVQVSRAHNHRAGETRLVEQVARGDAERDQVA